MFNPMLKLWRGLSCCLMAIVCLGAMWFWGWTQPAFAATAQATIQSTSDASGLNGVVYLQETEAGLVIDTALEQTPEGPHGFHIHEFGSCDDAGNAAGGHYNPDGVKHGYLFTDGFANAHAGDLGNIVAADNGTATYRALVPGLGLTSGYYPVADHAIIVHDQADDFGQPTGNAGARIGCGVIQVMQ